jgi:hypothetical protein
MCPGAQPLESPPQEPGRRGYQQPDELDDFVPVLTQTAHHVEGPTRPAEPGLSGVAPLEDAHTSRSAGGAELEAVGKPIGAYDVLLAGQAQRHGATLVTSNSKEFARVSGLLVEDWREE